MKVIVKSERIYRFDELSEKAQGRAAVDAINDGDGFYISFTEEANYVLDHRLGQNEHDGVEIQYAFSFSQGDGVNLCGTFTLGQLYSEALWHMELEGVTPPETPADVPWEDSVTLPPNHRYTYSLWDSVDYRDMVEAAFVEGGFGERDAATFARHACAAMADLCAFLYEEGEAIVLAYYEPDHWSHAEAWYYADGSFACTDYDLETFHPVAMEA